MRARHIAALAAASTLSFVACAGPVASRSPVSVSTNTPAASPSPTFAAPVVATSVSITNFSFKPQVIVVKTGAEVTWTNKDTDAHTVTFYADGSGSKAFQNGESYRNTFGTAGTFKYHCSIHPYMVGEVIVNA